MQFNPTSFGKLSMWKLWDLHGSDPFLTSDGESAHLVSILKDPETEPSRAAVPAFDGQQAGIDRSDPTRRNP